MSKNVKAKATPKPKAASKASKPKKKAEDVLNDLDGVIEVVVVDDDLFDIAYDEALLEEAAILAALDDEDYDVILID